MDANEQHRKVGVCLHGKSLHYRYPCAGCEADSLTNGIMDEVRAGFTLENGLQERVRKLAQQEIEDVLARVRA